MSTKARAVRSRYSSPWVYFALTLSWSWVFWITAAILGNSFDSLLTVLLFAMGGLGPAIVAISLTYLTLGSEGLRDYWLRVIDFKRIGLRWYIAAHPIGDVFPPGSIRFWLDFVVGTAFAGPELMTWIYNNTGRSTLSAILFHFMGNFTGEFLQLPDPFRQYQTMWFIATAVLVILVWGPRTLRLQPTTWERVKGVLQVRS